ncbi:precorrin-8X methylmutase [Breznakiellaceae bacterium SP9]
MNLPYRKPKEIEKRSFEIIRQELKEQYPDFTIEAQLESILIRIIHTTADFSHVQNFCTSEGAAAIGVQALRDGARIITDTYMVRAGINKDLLDGRGQQALCYIADEETKRMARSCGCTRAEASMDSAAWYAMSHPIIVAIGNAPTALARICELSALDMEHAPKLIIGVPVGFVNVIESKKLLMAGTVPYITIQGRKGGSNVAAAICNALLRLAEKDSP